MLTIYHSNKLDVLKGLISHIMTTSPLKDPFEEEVIVVQSQGMAKWLQLELCADMGILANVSFPLPSAFFWQLFSLLEKDKQGGEELMFDKLTLTWLVMKVLPSLLHLPEFSSIQSYLADDDDQRKRQQLALKCADVFDHYLVYRPHWALSWEKGEKIAQLGDKQDWQAKLWFELIQTLKSYYGLDADSLTHRASMYGELIDYLNHATLGSLSLPKRIFVCGISSLPPLSILVLEALGRHSDVHLMYTNPCRYYWADLQKTTNVLKSRILQRKKILNPRSINDGLLDNLASQEQYKDSTEIFDNTHSLLANWGKLAKEQLYQFAQLSQVQEIDAFVDETEHNVLTKLKSDILNLKNRQVLGLSLSELNSSQQKICIEEKDDSISFHVCHSMVREIEVLHDYLLTQFEADPNLEPKDVIVMVSDIGLYAPYIQAIFNNAPASRYLPFSIADRSLKATHPLVELITQLLELPKKRFNVDEIIQLLSSPALLNRFGIEDPSLEQLIHWIENTHIYWGRDDEWLKEQDLPSTGQYTWRFGLDKLLLGLTKAADSGLWQGKIAYDGGQVSVELVGQFCELIETLMLWQDTLSKKRTLTHWHPLFAQMLEALLLVDEEDAEIVLMLREAWELVIQKGVSIGYQETISLNLLAEAWEMNIEQTSSHQRFLAGKINFCTLMPMRSIPFKQVCLLGMSEALYPRSVVNVSFDLMRHSQEIGDRSRRDDDKFLFLEALLSAEHRLYISYVGVSIATDEEKNPSIVVSELLEYLSQSYVLKDHIDLPCDDSSKKMKEFFITLHARVPYAKENYQLTHSIDSEKGRYSSFANEWLAVLNNTIELKSFIQPIATSPEQLPRVIRLEALTRFYRQPVEFFFKTVLGISFNSQLTPMTPVEPFQSVDKLSQFFLKQKLFNYFMQGIEISVIKALMLAEGDLPAGAGAEKILNPLFKQVKSLYDAIAMTLNMQEINLQNAQWSLEITLDKTFLEECLTDKSVSSDEVRKAISLMSTQLNGFERLEGWIKLFHQRGLVEWRLGDITPKHYFSFWLKHLLVCLSLEERLIKEYEEKEHLSTLIGISKETSEVVFLSYPYLSKNEAAIALINLINYFYLGHEKPIFALPDSCDEVFKPKKKSEADEHMTTIHRYDVDNSYVHRILSQITLKEREHIENEIQLLAETLYAPVLEMARFYEAN